METQLTKQARSHMTGARNELLAASYYLQRGCNVYWPTCQHTVVDFVVEIDSGMKKVQVKTAHWVKRGKSKTFSRLQCPTRNMNVPSLSRIGRVVRPITELYDILFAVALSPDKSRTTMWEIPSSAILPNTVQQINLAKKFDHYKVSNFHHLPFQMPKNYKNENN